MPASSFPPPSAQKACICHMKCRSRADLPCTNYRLECKLLTASVAFSSATGDKIKWM